MYRTILTISHAAYVKSYRPITVLSNQLEWLLMQQLVNCLTENDLLPDLQSVYREHQSTETAVVKVIADIILLLDFGNLVILSL